MLYIAVHETHDGSPSARLWQRPSEKLWDVRIYPLVNSHILPWKISIFHGKIHYFYGHFPWQNVNVHQRVAEQRETQILKRKCVLPRKTLNEQFLQSALLRCLNLKTQKLLFHVERITATAAPNFHLLLVGWDGGVSLNEPRHVGQCWAAVCASNCFRPSSYILLF